MKEISTSNHSFSAVSILVWVCRLSVGLLFVLSGWIKVNDIIGFSYKLDEYFEVFQAHFGLPAAPFQATSILQSALISILEVIIGFFLLFGYKPKATTRILLGTIIFFTFLTGYSWITESVRDCGCFGDAVKLTPFQSFMKDIILLVLAGMLVKFHTYIHPLLPRLANLTAVGLSSLGTVLLTAWCYFFLPQVDFLPACEGCNIKAASMTEKMSDYSSFGTGEFDGPVLLITVKSLEKLSPEMRSKLISLANDLKPTSIKVLGGTASLSDSLAKYGPMFPFPFSSQDGTLLKAMVRSNPGLLLMKDGIVIRKWSRFEMPDKEEIASKVGK